MGRWRRGERSGTGLADKADDCVAANAAVNPGAAEIAGDGIDKQLRRGRRQLRGHLTVTSEMEWGLP